MYLIHLFFIKNYFLPISQSSAASLVVDDVVTSTMPIVPLAFIVLVHLLVSVNVVNAVPYFMLKNKGPMCFQIDSVRPNQTYVIRYDAPDLIKLGDTDGGEINPVSPPSDISDDEKELIDQLFQRRMDALKRAVCFFTFFSTLCFGNERECISVLIMQCFAVLS